MPKFSVKEPVLAIALLAAGLTIIMALIQSKRQAWVDERVYIIQFAIGALVLLRAHRAGKLPLRLRLRFSLRPLLIATTLVAVVLCGWTRVGGFHR